MDKKQITFGKYKGTDWSDVPDEYIDYMVNYISKGLRTSQSILKQLKSEQTKRRCSITTPAPTTSTSLPPSAAQSLMAMLARKKS